MSSDSNGNDQVERIVINPELPEQGEEQENVEDASSQDLGSQREQMLLDKMKRLKNEMKLQQASHPDIDSPSSSSFHESVLT